MSAPEKSDKVAHITRMAIEAFGDGFSTFQQKDGKATYSDDEILEAFPNCVGQTLDALLKVKIDYISGKNSLFSKETLREEVKKLILSIIRDIGNRDLQEVVREYVDELLTSLSNYSKTHNVYIPLHGLTLSKEVGRLKLGHATLLRMDEGFFQALGKKTDIETPKAELKKATMALKAAETSERLENELSARQKEAQKSLRRTIDYEMQQLTDREEELKKRISITKRELRDPRHSAERVEELRNLMAMRRAELDVRLREIGTEARRNVTSRHEPDYRDRRVLEEQRKMLEMEMNELDRALEKAQAKERDIQHLHIELAAMEAELKPPKRKKDEALNLQMRIETLKARLAEVRKDKTEPSDKLRKRIERLRGDLASANEAQALINRFKDSSCLQYCYNADWQKAKEFAERHTTPVIDLLRYAIAAANIGENVLFRRKGEIVGDIPTFFIIESGTNDFQEMPSIPNNHPPLEITPTHVITMKGLRIFEMAALLTKEDLNSLERILMRCIHWHSLSQIQPDKGSELLNLVIVLETLFTREDSSPISTSISECVAMLLDDKAKERRLRKEKIRHIYGVRSNLVHGKKEFDDDDIKPEELAYLRATSKELISVVWGLYKKGRLGEDPEQQDLFRLLDNAKFNAPPIT